MTRTGQQPGLRLSLKSWPARAAIAGMRVALSVAGSDPSGGAGIQADLKAFHQHRVYGAAVITLLTVQNTVQVSEVSLQTPAFVAAQLDAVLSDLPVAAIKTGALGTGPIAAAVAQCLARRGLPLVVDPVVSATHGAQLLRADAIGALTSELLPLATIVTPNLNEAALLTGAEVRTEDQIRQAALMIHGQGAGAVLIKGGHREGAPDDLLYANGVFHVLRGERVAGRGTHGLGCNLSAAICAWLARGEDVLTACQRAKAWVARGIAGAPGLGQGAGPIDALVPIP
ncbi:MAG: bifunctional hydroxymethylpyrimidine kinase/phosphomethylpyrimidine kinase [Myxococcales bacterium]|nr:bifunctional hydroxymethylpyrimidine kinase/phosphomethylpyrimidine kinase [Myxococcales bacterium]